MTDTPGTKAETPATPVVAKPRKRRLSVLIGTILAVILVAAASVFVVSKWDYLRPSAGQAAPTATPSVMPTLSSRTTATPTVIASARPTPAPLILRKVVTQPLSDTEPLGLPVWQDSNDATKYGVDTLLYVQAVAKAAGLPVRPANYAVVLPGAPVACDYSPIPYIDGTASYSAAAIQWCPVVGALTVSPALVAATAGSSLYLDFAMDAYSQWMAVASDHNMTVDGHSVANNKWVACYHGTMVRQRVVNGVANMSTAGPSLYNFYVGGDGLDSALLGYTTGKCFPPN